MDARCTSRDLLTDEVLSLAFETSGDCVQLLDAAGAVLAVRAHGAAALAFDTSACALGGDWTSLWDAAGQIAARAALAKARKGEAARAAGLIERDGRRSYWESRIVPLPAADGRPERLLAVSRDVTARHEAALQLESRRRLHQALIEATSEIVWHFDVTNGIIERRGWTEFTGTSGDPSDGEAWLALIHPDDRAATKAKVDRAIAARTPFIVEYRLLHHSGEWRWMEDHAVPLTDQHGALTDWIGIVSETHQSKLAARNLRRSEERLRLALEATSLGTWDVDMRTGAREWSAELKAMLGLPADKVPTEAVLLARVHPDDRDAVAQYQSAFAQTAGPAGLLFRIVRADNGAVHWIKTRGRAVLDDEGRTVRRIGTFQDVTEQQEIKQALALALRRHEALIAATSEIVWRTDVTMQASHSSGWTEFTGQPLEVAGGDGWLDVVHPDDRQRARDTAAAAVGNMHAFTNEYRLWNVSGQWRWVTDRVVPLFDDNGTLAEWVGIISDVHDRKMAVAQIWRAAHTDELTGVANRSLFQIRLEEAVTLAREQASVLGLILIDLDHFKEVNDTLGHDAGDAVLRTVASRLADCAPRDTMIARLGGDEFALIIADPAAADQTAAVAEAVLSALGEPMFYQERELDCSASIGFVTFAGGEVQPSALLKHADIALYAAKAAGRGRAFAFAPWMSVEIEHRQEVLGNARSALARDAVLPFYQPKVRLGDGAILGFEALLRWTDDSGLRGPGAIAEAFDDHDLSIRLGARMLERVLADMRGWLEAGVPFGHVALNIAAAELRQPGFAETMLEKIDSTGLPPWRLEIEVTESVLLDDGTEAVGRALGMLHAAGIKIALDDFGTGYASLTHLKRFPVSWLKIDRSFVSTLEKEPDSAAIVRALLGLARNLGIGVVAEGVETERQLAFLRQHQCDAVQGYLMAKPMAGSRVPNFLMRSRREQGKRLRPSAVG